MICIHAPEIENKTNSKRKHMMLNRTSFKEALATLREHLDIELTEVSSDGRYVLDFGAMTEIVDAIDEIEESLGDDDAEDSE